MEVSRQEYWSGLPFPPLGDLPDLEIKLTALASLVLAGRFLTPEPPGKPLRTHTLPLLAVEGKGFRACECANQVLVLIPQDL